MQLDDRTSLYLSEFGDEEISYSMEKRAIERDMFVTTLRTHDKFAPKGGKRREKIKDNGDDGSKSEISYQSSIIPAPPREFNLLPNSDPQLKVFEDVYRKETNGSKCHGQICVNRYTVQFLPFDESIVGVTIFLRNVNPDFVRQRKVGWTNAVMYKHNYIVKYEIMTEDLAFHVPVYYIRPLRRNYFHRIPPPNIPKMYRVEPVKPGFAFSFRFPDMLPMVTRADLDHSGS